ncbi:Hsp20/alpha crystallin family protein [Methanobrevibacter sp.]|uniref:Hsp20/alpha crystallin family protein n=1 Tax=Methanobrevibacter sp. TaxID=66852 RepID=UPI003867C61A
MVDSETIDTKVSDKKEEFNEEQEDEMNDTFEEAKDKFEERKEKGKNIADGVINDLYASIDEFKEYIRNMQKNADKKYAEYKKSTVQTIDIDLIETKDTYYIKAAVPGVSKDDVMIEAGDNDVTIEATFKAYIDEFDEEDEAEVIASSIKSGKCVKTVRFENSLDLEKITAKFTNGIVIMTIPKLIIPKHKINVE